MDPWNIIGWLILGIFVILPLLGFTIRKINEKRQWNIQKNLREELPKKWQTWKSLKTGQKYYINSNSYILVSVDANNNGGMSFSPEEWKAMVEREKLINI